MRQSTLTGTSALIRIFLAGIAILFVFNLARGGEETRISPTLIPREDSNELRLPDPISGSTHLEIDGEHFLIVLTKAGNEHIEAAYLRIISTQPDENLEQIGRLHTSMSIQTPPGAIAVANGHAYVGMAREGTDTPALWVVDISNPRRPFEANLLRADMPVRSLTATQDGLLVASGYDDRFLVYDISQPDEPVLVASFVEPLEISPRLAMSGSTLFVNDGASVKLLDLSVPDQPETIAWIDHPEWRQPEFIPRPGAFLTGEEGLDVNIPAGTFLDFSVGNSWLAIASGADGLVLIDLAEPAEPATVGGVDPDGRTVSVDLDGELAYVLNARQHQGSFVRFNLHTVDISTASDPEILFTSRDFVGIPRYQRVLARDGNVWLLFNSTILRIEKSD